MEEGKHLTNANVSIIRSIKYNEYEFKWEYKLAIGNLGQYIETFPFG